MRASGCQNKLDSSTPSPAFPSPTRPAVVSRPFGEGEDAEVYFLSVRFHILTVVILQQMFDCSIASAFNIN
jgi:hypothetical protein